MFAQESVMGINKEREDFEAEFSKIKSDIAFWLHTWDEEMQGYNHPVMCWFWYMWQAVKAQAVPEGFEIGRLQDRITELLDERQELYAQLDAGSTEGFILVEKDLVQSIHQSCVKCLDIDLPPIFRATVCTIRDEVAPLIEAQEPAND